MLLQPLAPIPKNLPPCSSPQTSSLPFPLPPRGLDFQGLFARREKPDGIGILILIAFVDLHNVNSIMTPHYFVVFRCSSRGMLCVIVV